MDNFRQALDDLETAAFRAAVMARRNREDTAGRLAEMFREIERMIDTYEETL